MFFRILFDPTGRLAVALADKPGKRRYGLEFILSFILNDEIDWLARFRLSFKYPVTVYVVVTLNAPFQISRPVVMGITVDMVYSNSVI